MSLKWFHVLFIVLSVLVTVFVAAWAWQQGQWLLVLVAIAAGAALVVYSGDFLRKTRNLE